MKAKKLNANPKDLIGITKTRLNLVPPSSIIFQAMAMEDGGDKYGPYNWRDNAVVASIYVAAAVRHLLDWWDGQELASDSKVPHLGHALSCIGIIVDASTSGNLLDDRPKPGPAPRLLEFFTNRKAKSLGEIEEFLAILRAPHSHGLVAPARAGSRAPVAPISGSSAGATPCTTSRRQVKGRAKPRTHKTARRASRGKHPTPSLRGKKGKGGRS